jgi:branched-subunit amino acid transport protein
MFERYIAIVLVALGTYLARFLPLRFKLRVEGLEEILSYSSTALISALFVTSLVSFPIKLGELYVSFVALLAVALTYKRWKNLGFSVLIGVIVHAILFMALSS